MVAEDLVSQFLTQDYISEVSQYDFNMEYITVLPKHIKLPKNGYGCREILGLYIIANPFKIGQHIKTHRH